MLISDDSSLPVTEDKKSMVDPSSKVVPVL